MSYFRIDSFLLKPSSQLFNTVVFMNKDNSHTILTFIVPKVLVINSLSETVIEKFHLVQYAMLFVTWHKNIKLIMICKFY